MKSQKFDQMKGVLLSCHTSLFIILNKVEILKCHDHNSDRNCYLAVHAVSADRIIWLGYGLRVYIWGEILNVIIQTKITNE